MAKYLGEFRNIYLRIMVANMSHEVNMQYKQLLNWTLKNNPSPPPHLVKIETIKKYLFDSGSPVFVETGVGSGATLMEIAKLEVECFSIELDSENYEKARSLFANFENVSLIQGDSARMLPRILESLEERALFWLDAHYSYGNKERAVKETPIEEELFAILEHSVKRHTILIDDVRLFGNPRGHMYHDYPTIHDVLRQVKDSGRGYTFENFHDILRIKLLN